MLAAALASAAAAWWFWPRIAPFGAASSNENTACAPLPDDAKAPHPGMVWVPAGRLDFGDTVYPEEQPVRGVQMQGFWIDRTEVSNDAFARFVAASGYITVAERPVDPAMQAGLPEEMRHPGAVVFVPPGAGTELRRPLAWWRYVPGASWRHPGGPGTTIESRGRFPVVAITYEDARAYARWAGRSLPTEAQWEWAARGASAAPTDEHAQPREANTWQGAFPLRNSGDDGFLGLAPVGCYAPNALGLYDMVGNVWELVADLYAPHHGDPPLAPGEDAAPVRPGAPVVPQHVIKGGSYLCAPNYCMRYRAGARQPQDEDLATSHLGFRTVLNAPGP